MGDGLHSYILYTSGLLSLACGSPLLWVIMCVWALVGIKMLHLQRSFEQDIDVISFLIFVSISDKPIDKIRRKLKQAA